jgi:mRNA interferase HigB
LGGGLVEIDHWLGQMKLVGKEILARFTAKHEDSFDFIRAWIAEAEEAKWENFRQLKKRYLTAHEAGGGRVIFGIRDDAYRLEVRIDFRHQILVVTRAATNHESKAWASEQLA